MTAKKPTQKTVVEHLKQSDQLQQHIHDADALLSLDMSSYGRDVLRNVVVGVARHAMGLTIQVKIQRNGGIFGLALSGPWQPI